MTQNVCFNNLLVMLADYVLYQPCRFDSQCYAVSFYSILARYNRLKKSVSVFTLLPVSGKCF